MNRFAAGVGREIGVLIKASGDGALDSAGKKVDEAKEYAGKKVDEAKNYAGKKVDEAKNYAGKKVDEAGEYAGRSAGKAKAYAGKKVDSAKAYAGEQYDSAKGSARAAKNYAGNRGKGGLMSDIGKGVGDAGSYAGDLAGRASGAFDDQISGESDRSGRSLFDVGLGTGAFYGAPTGMAIGAGLGGILNYLKGDRRKQSFSDYLKAMLTPGLLGGLGGAAVGGGLGLGSAERTRASRED